MVTFALKVIGHVASSLTDPLQAPKQPDEDAPEAWLVFDSSMAEALQSLKTGDKVVVVTWLDRARRDVLTVHPRGDRSRTPQGVFSTRSPHRPNPIGLHDAMIAEIDGTRVRVDQLEALEGTPIIDLKPALSGKINER